MAMIRLVKWVIGTAISQSLIFVILAWLLPGFDVNSLGGAVLMGLIATVVIGVSWPVIYRISSITVPILFPIISFALSALMVFVSAWIVDRVLPDSVNISSFWTAMWIAVLVTFVNTFAAAIFSLNDDAAYNRFVTSPLVRQYRNTPKSDVPGIFFLEIDGLAIPILRKALSEGYMPTLKQWLDEGRYTITGWEPDLSSQTSASQAGILLGSNEGIPAFRWYDKDRGKLMVSSKRDTARELETQLSTGNGLLAPDGASRWNVFSGGAVDCLATFSKIGDPSSAGTTSYFAYFANPYSLARMFGLLIAEVFREIWQANMQKAKNVLPRVHRGIKYAFVRGGTNVVLLEASAFMVISDLLRGVPSGYYTLFAYDEVAHHSGIDRTDSLKVLRLLDTLIARVEAVREHAPRPYHLVFLSDHGQSQGATFLQRYGQTLGDLTNELVGADAQVSELGTSDEGYGGLSAAMTEAIRDDSRTAGLVRRTLQSRTQDGEVDLEPESELSDTDLQTSQAVVLASGNLGLISFPAYDQRMTFEQITNEYPRLLPGLVNHEGISFVVVRSEEEGDMVIAADGLYYLDHGYAVENDPLTKFGPNAALHLKRESGFSNAPDILVMSMFDPETGEVAAFEELVGCHGGLGGPQVQPFVMHPVELGVGDAEPIVGAGALHQVLKGWVEQARVQSTSPN